MMLSSEERAILEVAARIRTREAHRNMEDRYNRELRRVIDEVESGRVHIDRYMRIEIGTTSEDWRDVNRRSRPRFDRHRENLVVEVPVHIARQVLTQLLEGSNEPRV